MNGYYAAGETSGWGEAMIRAALTLIALVVGAAAGLGAGYVLWNKREVNWYAVDINKLGPGPENDLIRYGKDLIVNTARHIGKNATDPALRYAGNDLSCQNCHLNAGLQPFAAPFISTFATFPMMVDDQVLTLSGRLNGCMRRSLNGKDLPPDSREMQALIAYIKFVGTGTPDGVRLPGSGLKPIEPPALPPDSRRGQEVYAQQCAKCHKEDGQGELKPSPDVGYSIPPLWGEASFNAGAGMAKIAYAASYIQANMPFGISYVDPVLTVQQAWDVAAFMDSKPHPPATAETGSDLQ
jgi:thiosulfate dehydrogenase